MNKQAKTGDIYCMRSHGKNSLWCAYQIVAIEKDYFILIDLDWYSENLMTTNDFKTTKPLIENRYSGSGQIAVKIISYSDELIAPERFIYIGNYGIPDITIKIKKGWLYEATIEYNGNKFNKDGRSIDWPTPWVNVYLENEWLKFPEAERLHYKNCYKNTKKIAIKGLNLNGYVDTIKTGRVGIKDNGIQDWSVLDVLGCLGHLDCEGTQNGLTDYLQNRRMITNLNWQPCTTELVDISRTNIKELRIDVTNVKEINLSQANEKIFLYGAIHNSLKIFHTHKGEGLSIYIDKLENENVPNFNLPNLSDLRLKPSIIDAKTIVDAYPNLTALIVWGNLGIIKNINLLGNLSQLIHIQLSELFGFKSSDFPTRKQWSKLEILNIYTYPKEVTQHITKEFSEIEKFELRQPKTMQWVEDNIDNPFRIWDGRHFSEKELKIAHTAYKKVSSAIRKLKHPFDENEVILILKEFVLTLNKICKNIWTLERDEVSSIFDELLMKLNIDPNNKKYQDLFDEWRDF